MFRLLQLLLLLWVVGVGYVAVKYATTRDPVWRHRARLLGRGGLSVILFLAVLLILQRILLR